MPQIRELYQNSPAFGATSWVSEFVNLDSSSYTTFTVYCDQNCNIVIEYAVDDGFQVIDTETTAVVGGTTEEVVLLTKTQFCRYKVMAIAANPADLKTTGFFFERGGLGVQVLQNVGGFSEVFKAPTQVRTFQSSDASLTITQNANDIDIVSAGGAGTIVAAKNTDVSVVESPAGTYTVGAGSGNASNSIVLNNGNANATTNAVMIGEQAGWIGGLDAKIAIGYWAGRSNADDSSIAIGKNAGASNLGKYSVAIGREAGNAGDADYAVHIGHLAGDNFSQISSIGIGREAGETGQGPSTVAIGYTAGTSSQGNGAVAIGLDCGQSSQQQYNVAMGYRAAQSSGGLESVALGTYAGNSGQGSNAVAIGRFSANSNQGGAAVAIGNFAGNSTQGGSAVGIGPSAGQTSQGANAVAVGNGAAGSSQGDSAIAVGRDAGNSSQGINAVAIGKNAGRFTQGAGGVAIGLEAGLGVTGGVNFQGAGSICIGDGCGAPAGVGAAIGADAILLGHDCAATAVVGRLGFGANMDPLITQSNTSIESVGDWMNMDYNGTSYRVPMFSNTATDIMLTAPMIMPVGEISFENFGTTYDLTVTTSNTFYRLAPTTVLATNSTSGASVWFDNGGANDGSLRYKGVTTQYFHLAASVSALTSSSNQTWEFEIQLNGVKIPRSGFRVENPNNASFAAAYHVVVVQMATDDVVTFWLTNRTSSAKVLNVGNLNVVLMGTIGA